MISKADGDAVYGDLDQEVIDRLTASRIVQAVPEGPDRTKLIALAGAIAEAVKGLPMGIPSGHLYANLMGQMSLLDYQLILSVIKAAGMIEVRDHYITWVAA